ncbi:hypothetical protein KC865_00535 [Candidatus Kaiserbacteria bacterium]|nr:hypothetical protein [Candidatus Kaiserbacteria bacterium]USN91970.1 MAG: hypothetical protein H6782_03790 [Candidatus Nomurabacteria bacterium]
MPFTINKEPFGNFTKLNIRHDDTGNTITILPEMGARLNHFQVGLHGESVDIIDGYSDTDALAKESMSKSSFLAPYPNRIADGKYRFNNNVYQFDINKPRENNSIHGFLSNQIFTGIKSGDVDDCYEIILSCKVEGVSGYPFPFSVDVVYRFGGVWLQVDTIITNTGQNVIPVGFGWHPYFRMTGTVDNLLMQMSGVDKIEVDKRLIPTGEKIKYKRFDKFTRIGDIELDTGFVFLNDQKEIQLLDEAHGMYVTISMRGKDNQYKYVQLYTPPHRGSIAIEPMTCATDAFNNGWGLKKLSPRECLRAQFTIMVS